MNQLDRFKLATRIYNHVLDNTESFELQNIGSALAYLLGAILKNGKIEVVIPPSEDPHTGPLWILLNDTLPDGGDDPVFDFFSRVETFNGRRVKGI